MADEEEAKPEGEAAEGEGGEEGKEGKSDKKKSAKKLIIITIVLILDLAIMAGISFFIVGAIKGEDPTVKAMKEEELAAKEKAEMVTRMGTVLEAPIEMTVNIVASDNEPHFLKCKIQLEWDGIEYPTLGDELSRRQPKITDIILGILSKQTMDILLTYSGKQTIRESIISDINAILPTETGQITSCYFVEFLVQ